MLPDDAGPVLTGIARDALERELGARSRRHTTGVDPGWLDDLGATFVTLTQDGELRGCIGSLQAWRPLRTDVADNAVAAGTRDPRFDPMTADELPRTRIEVSVLSAPEPFEVASEADAVARLRPYLDGVILSHGSRRGTFLPQVWEQLPDPARFLARLKRKAGFPESWWDPAVRLERYTVAAYHEPEGAP